MKYTTKADWVGQELLGKRKGTSKRVFYTINPLTLLVAKFGGGRSFRAWRGLQLCVLQLKSALTLLEGSSIRSHRARAQSQKTFPHYRSTANKKKV